MLNKDCIAHVRDYKCPKMTPIQKEKKKKKHLESEILQKRASKCSQKTNTKYKRSYIKTNFKKSRKKTCQQISSKTGNDAKPPDLLVEVDVLEDLESLVVVAQQRVETQQANQTEVAQHLVQRVLTKVS